MFLTVHTIEVTANIYEWKVWSSDRLLAKVINSTSLLAAYGIEGCLSGWSWCKRQRIIPCLISWVEICAQPGTLKSRWWGALSGFVADGSCRIWWKSIPRMAGRWKWAEVTAVRGPQLKNRCGRCDWFAGLVWTLVLTMRSVLSFQRRTLCASSRGPCPVQELNLLDSGVECCDKWEVNCILDRVSFNLWHVVYR